MSKVAYFMGACAWPCKAKTVHYKVGDGPARCIRHEPNSHDIAEFMLKKTGYQWGKYLQDCKRLMQYGVSSN